MVITQYTHALSGTVLELLLLADPNAQAVEDYFQTGTTFVAIVKEKIVGVAVLVISNGCSELKNIAVEPACQRQGVGSALLQVIIEQAKRAACNTIIVGTGNSSLDQLGFYQRHGFRMDRIVPDHFAHYPQPIFENGIRCLDLVVLKQAL